MHIGNKLMKQEILFRNKLRADWSREMLAFIRCRIFCLQFVVEKQRLRHTGLQFCLLFCMVVKIGRLHWGRNVCWGYLRIGCWGRYLGLRWTNFCVQHIHYNSVSQPLWDRGPVNTFFHKTRARSQQIYSSVPFQSFLSSYTKLT